MIKTWVFVVIIVLLVAVCVALGVVFLTNKEDGHIANVYVEGEIVYSVDLNEVETSYEKEITTEYGKNVLLIEKGKIRVIDADCDGKECINMGYVTDSSTPIVCLPHRLVIKIEKEGDIDVVSK